MRAVLAALLIALGAGTAGAAEPVTYTLITVNRSAAVFHSDGYPSLDLCEEARHIAMTGETLAQTAERERTARLRALADHEARANGDRRRHRIHEIWGYSPKELEEQGWYVFGTTDISTVGSYAAPRDLRYAECVIVPRKP